MGFFRSDTETMDVAKDRLARALVTHVLREYERTKNTSFGRHDAVYGLNTLLREIGAGSDPKITEDLLDDSVGLEDRLRNRMEVPAQTLLRLMPGRIKDWIGREVPPEWSAEKLDWFVEGIRLLDKARISPQQLTATSPEPRRGLFGLLLPRSSASKRAKRGNAALALGFAMSAVIGFFPPWTGTVSENGTTIREDLGFSFLFNPPRSGGWPVVGIDTSRLLVEWLCVWCLVGAIVVFVRRNRKSPEAEW